MAMEHKLIYMSQITVTEKENSKYNLFYIQSVLSELLNNAGCKINNNQLGSRFVMTLNCPDYYKDIIYAELVDKLAEIIVIKYKYDFFKKSVKVGGLSEIEKEILLASLISADLEEDKKYTIERFKGYSEIAIDGIYNFRLQPLKRKWEEIVSYMPSTFVNSQLKDFIMFLLENKKKKVYIEGGKVYDAHYQRLKRSNLLDGEKAKVVREVLLSNCGEIELIGELSKEDEFYLKEFYADKINFSDKYYS